MAVVKFKGTPIEFADGVEYVVPALTLRHVQALQSRLAKYTGQIDSESIQLVIDTVHASLSRNYPDITADDVAGLVDLSNMARAMNAVMGVSGLVEADKPGEAVATA